MERLILDASAVIALERGYVDRNDVLPADADVAMSAVSASELLVGVELADEPRRAARRNAVEGLLEGVEVIPFDLTVARQHAVLLASVRRAGEPRGAHDLQIAATARATGRTVLTADAHAFAGLPGVEHQLLAQA